MADLTRKTANLFDYKTAYASYINADGDVAATALNLSTIVNRLADFVGQTVTIRVYCKTATATRVFVQSKIGSALKSSNSIFQGNTGYMTLTVTPETSDDYWSLSYGSAGTGNNIYSDFMVNTGSTALPYEPYGWVHSLRKLTTATEAVENPLYSDGTAITAYNIKGNTVQSGTPTPSAPISVNGVGNKTANLSPVNTLTGTASSVRTQFNTAFSDLQFESDTQYTISLKFTGNYGSAYGIFKVCFTHTDDTTTKSGWITTNPDVTTILTSTAGKTVQSVTITDYNNPVDSSEMTYIMLNKGSTAPPYEPSGYKIPILINQQTIDIYIGDLPLLKSLDGTAVDEISNGTLTRRVDSDGSVLPTPTTTQITMPSILTTEGANSITVDTTVQPSEFTATWTGWHDSSVKEYDGTDWQ